MHHFIKCASVGIVWFVVGTLTYTAWQVWKLEDNQRQATGRRYFAANPITEDCRHVTE